MSESTTPLLTNSFSPTHNPEKPEEIIEPFLETLTWRQILQVLLVSLASFFTAQQTFISIFTEAKQTWHCTDPELTLTCDAKYSFCKLPSDKWSWDNPAYKSIVSEWLLECAGSPTISGLPASSFFVGCLAGGVILFFIGDSYGRKTLMVFSCLTVSLSSFFIAFSNNVWTYSALRFVTGAGRSAIGSVGIVLTKELVGKKLQGKIVNSGFLMFTFGFMLLPGVAYYTRNYSWRVLYLVTSIPIIVYCILLYFLGYESPRWLLAQGRKDEAVSILKLISNSKDLSWDFDFPIDQEKTKDTFFFFKILIEKKEFLRNLIICMIMNSGIGLVYYGMALGVNNLDFNRYWSVVFNASLQVPSIFLIIATISKVKRRGSLLGLSTIAGICCVLLCFVGESKDQQVVLEVVSFFCSCTSFSLLLIYTAELFPTHIRHSAVAVVWLALMVGGAISPVLIAAGGDNKVVSFGVFGIVIIVTGSLVIFLPETLDSGIREDKKDEGEVA